MKHDRVNYFAVGLFVLAMLFALLVLLAMVTGGTGPTDRYYARFDNVSGLNLGTDVTYEGFRVGRVEDIESVGESTGPHYRVAFSVRRGWKIPRDSVARIFSAGLLAAFSIDIREGGSREYLEPGGELAGEAYPDVFTAVAGAADEARTLLISLQHSAAELNALIGGENRERVNRSIARLDEAMGRLNTFLGNANELLGDHRGGLKQSVSDLSQSVGTVAEHTEDIVHNLDETSRNLREFSRQIRNDPGMLLRSRRAAEEETGATP